MQKLDDLYEITNSNESFIDVDALGYSARVLRALSFKTGDDIAFKVLRRERLGEPDVWKRFVTEVKLLRMLSHTPVAIQMLDCGFASDTAHDLPVDGHIFSCDLDIQKFSTSLPEYLAKSWRPYIALERLPKEHNLLRLIRGADGDGGHPFRLPTEEGLRLAMQFTEFLCEMHELHTAYIDHKPEHVYWDGIQLRVIDFNVSQILEKKLGAEDIANRKKQDMRHFMASVLYTVFTGRDFRYQNQGMAPSARPSDPNFVENTFRGVTHLDFGMEETLLPQLTDLINQTMDPASTLTSVEFLDELNKCAAVLGWEETGYPASADASLSHEEILNGLSALREAQRKISEARDHFLTARAHHPNDQESRRLYREASEFYKHRVLP